MLESRVLKRSLIGLSAAFSLIIVFQNCSPGFVTDETMVDDLSSGDGAFVSLESKAIQILQTDCAACHGTNGDGGVSNITDVDELIQNGLVITGDSENSPLIISIINGSMPPDRPLADGSLQTLRDWIVELGRPVPSPSPDPGAPTSTPTPIPTSMPTPTPVVLKVTFQSLSKNILVPKCVSCHGANRADKGIRYDSYNETLRTVNKTKPAQSKLYTEVQSGSMPIDQSQRLSDSEVNMILKWIQDGALNN